MGISIALFSDFVKYIRPPRSFPAEDGDERMPLASGDVAGTEAVRGAPVGRYPYLVFWTVEAGEIWVLHIRHRARRVWRG